MTGDPKKTAFQALQRERDNAQRYLNVAGTILLAIGADERITLVNPKGCAVLGYEEPELIGRNWFDTCLPERVRDEVRGVFRQLMAGQVQNVESYESMILTQRGQERTIAWQNTVLRDETGCIVGTFSSGEDITDRRQTERALQLSERRYRTLFENLPIGLYRNTPGRKGGFMAANPAIARMFGYDSVEEFLQVNVADLYMDPGERKRFSDLLAAQGSVTRFELRLKRRDGTPIWGAITAHAVYNDAGDVEYFDGAIEDITERKRAEAALQESEERHRTLVQNLPIGLYRRTPGPQGRFLAVNPAHMHILGYDSVEDLLNARIEDIYLNDEDRIRFAQKLLAEGQVTREEIPVKKKDGTPIWMAVTARAEKNSQGDVEYFDGIIEDITERKRFENALKQSEEKLRVIVENVGLGVVLINDRMEIEQVNDTLRGWYPTVDFAARPICHQVLEDVPLDVPCPECPTVETFRDGQIHECVRTRVVGGRSVHFRHRSSPVCDKAGRVVEVIQILEDITEREIARRRMDAAARLVSELSPMSDRTELLNLVIHRATELLEADFGVFVELDPESGAIGAAYPANFPLAKIPEGTSVKGQGVLGWIAQGNTVFSADITRDPHYVGYPEWHPTVGPCIGMPLSLLNKILGLMLIGRGHGKEPFTETDRNFARILAHHAAVAIDRTRRMEMLHTLSIVDELTGLHNRRGFLILAEQQMKMAARAGKGFLLVFADLDGLKQINDVFGHTEGDAALVAAAGVLRATFRESDIVARMGGDEFAAIAVLAPLPTDETLQARLQENVAACNTRCQKPFALAISVGVTAYDPQMPCSMDELLTRADALMYQQKRARHGETR